MAKKTRLFICNTPYHYIVALQMIRTIFKDDRCDIVLSDIPNDSEKIVEKSQNLEFVNNVFFERTKFLQNITGRDFLKKLFFVRKAVKKMSVFGKTYDFIFTANIERYVTIIYTYQKKYKNKDIKLCWYEDGMGTYAYEDSYFKTDLPIQKKTFSIKGIIKKIFFPYLPIQDQVSELFVFNPGFMLWTPPFRVNTIPVIDKNDKQFISVLNKIFSYDDLIDDYSRKVIFFEDGYGEWNSNSEDLKLLQIIAASVGKENIIVKIHPRNRINRFAEIGYMTNSNTSIPWEVIALNSDLQNCYLVTVFSQSVVLPFILFGNKTKSVLLYNLCSSFSETDVKYKNFFSSLCEEKYTGVFNAPKTIKELKQIFAQVEDVNEQS